MEDNKNMDLSFKEYKEAERIKHVHGLHPYKGKFIPQLVEYFLKEYFKAGDIILDPFAGSGTTLIQSNELGIHAIGVDISEFNVMLSNVKVRKHDLNALSKYVKELTMKLENFQDNNIRKFEDGLQDALKEFNDRYFASKNEKAKEYVLEKEREFLDIYNKLVNKCGIKIRQDNENSFLDVWYAENVRKELEFLTDEIKKIKDKDIGDILYVILSRTARSCRATTHSDLTTLKEPVYAPYYCRKHKKICKPIFSIFKWWKFYAEDSIKRLAEFDKIRTDTFQVCLVGDSRKIDIFTEMEKQNPRFANILKKQKIKGIFTSPPYIGLIDYHDQHAYAYELLRLERRDDLEIGSLSKGVSKKQKGAYVRDIADVLINCKKFLDKDVDIFIVVNDKHSLYPQIIQLADMKIIDEFKRPVLHRAERSDNSYFESIFHLKSK
jgi:DNA modification methylase